MIPKRTIRTARDTVCNVSGLLQLSFLRTTMDCIDEILAADQSSLNEMKQELALIEQGTLYIKKQDTKNRFYERIPNTKKEKYINKAPERIHLLARREFLEQRIRTIESQIKYFRTIYEKSYEAAQEQRMLARLHRYANAELDLSRILFTKDQNEWIDEPFTPNPYHPEDLKYPTAGNILMRSKSEARIGTKLESLGLPYRPDDIVFVETKSPRNPGLDPNHINYSTSLKANRETYFADFKVPNLNGGITIHEHLGAFQLEKYSLNALQRLNDYHNFTLHEIPKRPVLHEEITWSLEYELFDPILLQRLVRRMLLPFSI